MTNINQAGFLSLTLLTASLALHGMARSTLTQFDAPGAGRTCGASGAAHATRHRRILATAV